MGVDACCDKKKIIKLNLPWHGPAVFCIHRGPFDYSEKCVKTITINCNSNDKSET